MRHFGYFWPNYKHYFGTVSLLSMGKSSWFSFLQKTLIFSSKTPKSSQNKILAVKNLEKSHRTSVFGGKNNVHTFFKTQIENNNVPLKIIYSVVHSKAWLGQGRASQHLLLRSHFPFWGHSESPSGTVEVEQESTYQATRAGSNSTILQGYYSSVGGFYRFFFLCPPLLLLRSESHWTLILFFIAFRLYNISLTYSMPYLF